MFPFIPDSKRRVVDDRKSSTSPAANTTPTTTNEHNSTKASRRSVLKLQQLLEERDAPERQMAVSARSAPRAPSGPSNRKKSVPRADSAPNQHRSGSQRASSSARASIAASPHASPSPRRIKPHDEDGEDDSRKQSKFRAVAFVDTSTFSVECPECGVVFSAHDDILFRRHVFECRYKNGVDPLMPLHLVLRNAPNNGTGGSSSRASSASTNFNGVSRPINSSLVHVDLFDGVPLTPKLDAPASVLQTSSPIRSALLAQPNVQGTPYMLTPAPPPNTAAKKNTGAPPRLSLSPPANATRLRQMSTATTSLGRTARKGVAKPPAIAFAPGSLDAEVEAALVAALYENDSDDCVLDLTGLTISHRQASRIEAVLAPNDGSDQLPVSTVILVGTKVVGEDSTQRLFTGIMKNKFIESLDLGEQEDSGTEHQSPTTTAAASPNRSPLDRLLSKTRYTTAGVHKVLENNIQRRKDRESNGEFLDEVESYLQRGKAFNEGVYALIKRVNVTVEQLQRAEAQEREKLADWIARAKARDALRRRRLDHEHAHLLEREAFFVAEERRRSKLLATQMQGVCILCDAEEECLRDSVVAFQEQLGRARLKMEERENIWRCLVVRDHRRGSHTIRRLFVEEEAEHDIDALAKESVLMLEGIKQQQGQHHKVSLWRRRMREDVENFIRYESKLRESVSRDEDTHWSSSKEKFFKGVEATMVKVAAQRQYVEDSERIRRKELEGMVSSYLDLEYQFLRAESRLLAQKQKSVVREHKRRDLLAKVPSITITMSPAQPEVLVFATQTPKHAAPEPATLFKPGYKVSCGMPVGWTDDLAHAEQLCKTSVNEEKSSITDYVQLLRRSLLVKNEAFECACDPINDEPSMDTLLAITRPTPVFTSAWKQRDDTSSSGGGGNALRPSLTMVRGSPIRTRQDMTPEDDEIIASEIDRLLQHRCAWYDKVPVSTIRAAKEQLYGARLTVQFTNDNQFGGESSAFGSSAVTHKLLSSISHVLQQAQAERRAEIHRLTQERVRKERKNRHATSGLLVSSTSIDDMDAESVSEGPPTFADPVVRITIDGNELPPITISDPIEEWVSVARSRTNSIAPNNSGGGGMLETSMRRSSVGSDMTIMDESTVMCGDDDQGIFEVPSLVAADLPSAVVSVTIDVQCARQPHSSVDWSSGGGGGVTPESSEIGTPSLAHHHHHHSSPHHYQFLDPTLLSSMLESIMYRVDIAEEEAGKHGAGLKKVDYTMEVDLHQSDCYHRHHPDVGQLLHTSTSSPSTIIPVHSNKITSQSMAPPVPELYHPRQPADNIQPITISTTGSYHVGVVPSCIAVDDEVGARCVVIEGQMDGIPIVRGITSVEDKYVIVRDTTTNSPTSTDDSTSGRYIIKEKAKCNYEELRASKVCGGLPGGTIIFEVVGEGATNGDRLSLEDELPTAVRFDAAQDRMRAIRTVFINDFAFASITAGLLQMTGSVTPSVKRPRHSSYAELRIDKDYAQSYASTAISTLLSKLRYHNYDSGPEEGTRELRIKIRSSTGAESEARIPFIVEGIDKPTELRLPYKKLTYRSPTFSIPVKLQPNCTEILVPVCLQALVVDEDTDRFSGGSAKFVLVGGCKGDSLAFCPNTRLHNFIDDVTDVAPLLSVSEPDETGVREVYMDDRTVATLDSGPVLFSRDNLGDEEHTEVSLTFAQEDNCSISAVQAICRAIVLVNSNPAFHYKTHPLGQRDVRIELQIMDNEQACEIVDNVSIRGGAHTIHLLERGTTIDFKEGNQPCKLGYFDLNSDKINPINNFGGGWILATIAYGGDNDVLGLKQEDSEYKVIEPKIKKGADGLAQMASTMMGASSGGAISRLKALSSKIGNASLAASASVGRSMAFSASSLQTPAEGKFPGVFNGFARPVLVQFSGMTAPMAAVMTVPNGLLIQFFPDTKRDAVTRKHALTLLRNITYYHDCQHPQFTQKVARVLVCDHPSSTPSQSLVSVNLEVTDDVTELRVKSPKKRMVQAIQSNYPLFPHGRAVIYDLDTDYFDGATFTVQCVAGSTRGDSFAFVPPYEQVGFVQRTNTKLAEYTCKDVRDLTFSEDQKLVLLRGVPVARTEFAFRDNGMCEVKVIFEAPGSAGSKTKTNNITRDVFTYIVNSICFGNQADKLRDNTRVMVARIKDPGNPVEGKLRMNLDVCPSHMVLSPPGPTFESLLFTKMPISPEVGSGVNPGARISLNLDRIHDLKNTCGVAPHCRITVTCASPDQLARVRLFLPLEEHGLKLYAGGNIAMNNGAPAFQLDNTNQHSVLLTFLPNSKPSAISKDKLQNILRSVVVSVSEELAIKKGSGSVADDTLSPPPEDASPSYDEDSEVPVSIPTVRRTTSTVSRGGSDSRRGSDQSNAGGASTTNTPRKPALPRKISLSRIRTGRDRRGSVVGFAPSPQAPMYVPPTVSVDSEDSDDVTLVVTWSLHDGENETRIVTRLVPKRMTTATATNNSGAVTAPQTPTDHQE